ncbi:hypothetical protein bpln_1g20810 [Burkholderia plantarii]|nr:hypothetical protein bpln_1g20810 [Burkholderia plantarii]
MKIIFILSICLLSACALGYTKYDVFLFWGHLVVNFILLCVSISAALRAYDTENFRGALLGLTSVLLVIVPLALLFSNRYWHWTSMLDIRFNSASYSACIRNSERFDGNQKLSVCWMDSRMDHWGFSEALVYDSSGEIASKSGHYSSAWVKAALSIQSKAPFGIIGFEAQPLGRNFYLVTFSEDLSTSF